MKFDMVLRLYLMSLSLKFHEDPTFGCKVVAFLPKLRAFFLTKGK